MHKTRFLRLAVLTLAVSALACDRFQTPAQRAAKAARDSVSADSTRRAIVLAAADSLSARPEDARWNLPDGNRGVASLALTADGRLLASDNESGNVSEIDSQNGTVVKTFRLGRQALRGDFVGLTATADGGVFQLDRNGAIYHFLEGGDGNRVEFLKHDTKLDSVCEFGGVVFDKGTNALVLACSSMKHGGDSLSLYRWKLDKPDGERLSEMRIAIGPTISDNRWKGFPVSDITIDPFTGNYLLLSARAHAVVEVTPQGTVVFSAQLPGKHGSATGIAITRSGALLIADGAGATASLTRYRWR